METIFVKPKDFDRKWYIVDAEGKTLGRIASEVAFVLRGKNKPYYTPHQECGDYVVIVNAEKVVVSGDKLSAKKYYRHSGYPGGLTTTPLKDMLAKKPTFPLERAIRGMLPKNRLGRKLFKNLKVYAGPNHPHTAQQPLPLEI
ncbi:50S ribosomal protein L13 [Spirochaeta lutea]|uniref:Large ribosomal subunit protein uL13 n=1 Tax=Spirochaeta lutea TaxID=1480694 RepID=A0A098QYN9_9SPIO|nr:50S ribosomal protein L13 [Spirochaeta lutea]KGE71607.1 50S ribosomal protein L13 [Spirochaeta lutea]